MYADKITKSMQKAIDETKRRREIQQKYNEEHNIIPKTIKKGVRDVIEATIVAEEEICYEIDNNFDIEKLKEEMLEAAKNLQFEKAAMLRDKINELEREK